MFASEGDRLHRMMSLPPKPGVPNRDAPPTPRGRTTARRLLSERSRIPARRRRWQRQPRRTDPARERSRPPMPWRRPWPCTRCARRARSSAAPPSWPRSSRRWPPPRAASSASRSRASPGSGRRACCSRRASWRPARGSRRSRVTADEELRGPFLLARSILGSPEALRAAAEAPRGRGLSAAAWTRCPGRTTRASRACRPTPSCCGRSTSPPSRSARSPHEHRSRSWSTTSSGPTTTACACSATSSAPTPRARSSCCSRSAPRSSRS